ncbi:hypothetical protein AAHA92_14992 [Salvia divinorum]|uniref:Uncharacterized protein n=1 Tax=Salvia divinorum TaxID=28513 RepID=A0ABD1HEN9_SALDI
MVGEKAVSEHGSSEYETNFEENGPAGSRSLSPTPRERGSENLEDSAGLAVHSNRFQMLEDEPTEEELSMAMVIHDSNTDARVIWEAKAASTSSGLVSENGNLRTEIARNGDSPLRIEGSAKKARFSTSRHA